MATEYESRPDLMEQIRRSQELFRPFIESGRLTDIEEVIQEEREKRDRQHLEALGEHMPPIPDGQRHDR